MLYMLLLLLLPLLPHMQLQLKNMLIAMFINTNHDPHLGHITFLWMLAPCRLLVYMPHMPAPAKLSAAPDAMLCGSA